MATYLISIVSEQTLPNYLLLKEFQPKIDKFIFISTDKMEKLNKTKAIVEAANLSVDKYKKIVVQETAPYKIYSSLQGLNFNENDKFVVNITGGTKIMSLVVFEFFRQFKDVHYFYVPIGTNTYKKIFLDREAKEYKINYKLSLKEYFRIYGVKFISKNVYLTESAVFEAYERFKNTDFNEDHFPYNVLIFEGPMDKHQRISEWFESFLYYKIKNILGLDTNQIAKGLEIFNVDIIEDRTLQVHEQDNEIDIAFIYNNNLYIIEAKKNISRRHNFTSIISNFLYKLAAINRNFGLRARATLMTLADIYDNPERQKTITQRSKLLNLFPPFDKSDFLNPNSFEQKLKQFLNS